MKTLFKIILVVAVAIGAAEGFAFLGDWAHSRAYAAVSDRRLPPLPPQKLTAAQMLPPIQYVSVAVQRACHRSPQASENVAFYFRQIGQVFAGTETNANFTAEAIIAAIDKIPGPLDADVSDVRNYIVCLYRMAYTERTSAEDPTVIWLQKICAGFRAAISSGLKDAGKEGV